MIFEIANMTLYSILLAYFLAIIIWNLIRSNDWKEQLLAAIVIIPFILRLLHIK